MNGCLPPTAADELLVAPVSDDSDEMTPGPSSWQILSVALHRAANLGFGIAVSGGRDNPHFTSGDPAVVISDVVTNGPAWGLLQLNDRILAANGVSFENIDYASAVNIIKDSEQIDMIVKRKVPMPVMEFEQRTLKFTLSKSRKKEDFGIVVGCKFYIKEIRNPKLAEKEPGLREGDSVLRINGQSLEGASLEEVHKWLERSRDKLCLVIQRDVRRGTSRWPSQNTVYERVGSMTATPRHSPSPLMMHPSLSARSSHEYINSPRWRPDGSLVDERRVSSPAVSSTGGHGPLNGEYEYYHRQQPKPDHSGVRTVTFRKVGGSVGIRVIGGNEVGIFVSAVAADSPAALHGVCCGDRIVEVNGRSMRGISRESAVQLLLALDDRVTLRLEHARQEFEHVRNNQLGDSFYVRVHFSKEKKSSPLELTVNEGDIFHITDTLFGGTVGLWQAGRVYSAAANKGEPVKGVIPNEMTAETLAREQRRAQENKGRGTLLRRKLEQRRTKSLPKNLLADPAELSASVPLPAYERVALNTPSFHRPVVLFGPLADVARQQLLSQFSMRFAEPESDGGVIRLAAIDAIIAAGKHCILDISIDSVERLQLAQYAPIVVLIDVDNRSRIRDIRKKLSAPHLSSKKLAEQTSQIKKHHSHLLSATVDASQEEAWFDAVRNLIGHLQQRRLWMPEFPPNVPLEDVLLFPLSVRSSNYDSDMESSKGGDYGDYSLKKAESNSRMAHINTRPYYDWDNSYDHSIASDPPSEHQRYRDFQPKAPNGSLSVDHHAMTSLSPKRTIINNDNLLMSQSVNNDVFSNNTNNPREAVMLSTGGTVAKEGPATMMTSSTTTNDDSRAQAPPPHSPGGGGYFHVKQLLNDESLYQDARLANEIANVRLREEARIREERLREEQRLKQVRNNERSEIPIQPPNPNMYSPREERATSYSQSQEQQQFTPHAHTPRPETSTTTVRPPVRVSQSAQPRPALAPKPNLYGDSHIRNKWEAHTPEPGQNVLNNNNLERTSSASSKPLLTQELRVNGSPLAPIARAEEVEHLPSSNGHSDENNQEEPVVVEETVMMVGPEGGVLQCPQSNVELRIPSGAIPEGEQHEISVKICREGDHPPIDKTKGETLLSPLVMCGPPGLTFQKPCELRLPHCGPTDGQDEQFAFSLKAGDGGKWKHLEFDQNDGLLDNKFISVSITHF